MLGSLHCSAGTMAPMHTGTLLCLCLYNVTSVKSVAHAQFRQGQCLPEESVVILVLMALTSSGKLIFVCLGTSAGLHQLSMSGRSHPQPLPLFSLSLCTRLTQLIITP